MHSAAPQMRVRPDSAMSTPSWSAANACAVRVTRSRTLGDVVVSTASATAPNASTASSRFQPSSCQPENTSTRAKVSQAARDPASSTTRPTAAAAQSQPTTPIRREARCSAKGDRLAMTSPSLRLHGPSTPLSRSASRVSATVHIGCPLIDCLMLSMPQNRGLVPVSACSRASTVHTATITPSPEKVIRRLRALPTAAATSHRNGR